MHIKCTNHIINVDMFISIYLYVHMHVVVELSTEVLVCFHICNIHRNPCEPASIVISEKRKGNDC